MHVLEIVAHHHHVVLFLVCDRAQEVGKHGTVSSVAVEQKDLFEAVARDLRTKLGQHLLQKLTGKADRALPHIKTAKVTEIKTGEHDHGLDLRRLLGDVIAGLCVRAHGQVLTVLFDAADRHDANLVRFFNSRGKFLFSQIFPKHIRYLQAVYLYCRIKNSSLPRSSEISVPSKTLPERSSVARS